MTASVTAAIYCRISLSDSGDRTKVEDQERICRQMVDRLGWRVHDVYSDNSISAWNRKKRRPEWERMLADVDAGHVNAIVAYHGDRLYRQPRDLEKLIDLAEGRGMLLASPMGEFDLSTSQGRIFARMLAAIAEGESARHSERRINQYDRWRREGRVRPGGRGGRAFGFATDGVTIIESEAQLLREAAQLVLAGHGCSAVARWLNDQGAVTPTGGAFSHTTVRKMLARPRYAGLMPDGASPAAWPAILERETWEAVTAALTGRATGFSYATNTSRYLLSGIARCGHDGCGAPMQIWRSQGRGNGVYQLGYRCSRCRRLFRSQPLLDAYVTGAVVRRLRESPAGRTPETPGLAAEFRALTDARAEAAAAVENPAAPHLPLLLARLDRIDQRLADLRRLSGESSRDRLLRGHAGITGEDFAALPLGVRRALVAACFDIVVMPATGRGPGFRPQDVTLAPR